MRAGRHLTGAVAGLLVGLAAAGLWLGGAFDRWEAATWDARVRLLAKPSAAADSLAIVLIDQPSLDWAEEVNGWSWPWPREVYTAVIGFCRAAGARAIAFDMLFTETSLYGVEDDATLAATMAEQPDCVVAMPVQPGAAPGDSARVTRPVPAIAQAAARLGNVADAPDGDGVFRRARLTVPLDGAPLPSLALAAFLLERGGTVRVQTRMLEAAGSRVPLDRHGRALLGFSPPGTYPAYSAAAVIQSAIQLGEDATPTLDPATLSGRTVLFGVSAPALMDQRPTPVQAVSPGVLLHATALDDLISGRFMRDAPRLPSALVIALFGAVAGLALAAGSRPRHVMAAAAILLPLPALGALLAYGAGWWWPLVPGELSAAGGLVAGLAVNYATEGRQRRFLKQAFRHYLSPDVIERLVADPGQLRLGGERRTLTIFFSDLAGFTSIGEKLDAEHLTALLNEYLTAMTDIILAAGGTLDKYEGDAIIAFWNAPLDVPDHATRACEAAVLGQRELARRREDWQARYGCILRTRIGIHTGEAVVGNLGSQQRFDYSVLGDAVNLASRLEGVNKILGTETLISRATRDLAGNAVCARELGAVVVVGRREPVVVCELVGLAGDPEPAAWTMHRQALQLCREGRRDAALAALAGAPDDPAAAALAAQLTADPAFRGVWMLTAK